VDLFLSLDACLLAPVLSDNSPIYGVVPGTVPPSLPSSVVVKSPKLRSAGNLGKCPVNGNNYKLCSLLINPQTNLKTCFSFQVTSNNGVPLSLYFSLPLCDDTPSGECYSGYSSGLYWVQPGYQDVALYFNSVATPTQDPITNQPALQFNAIGGIPIYCGTGQDYIPMDYKVFISCDGVSSVFLRILPSHSSIAALRFISEPIIRAFVTNWGLD
jgi:hypothetical protein